VTYTLTVTGVATDSTQGTTTTTTASATYGTTLSSPDSLGTVTFTPITGDDLSVDAGGNVTTSGTLNAGTYTVAVAWTDSNGDSGTVTYTLTVTGVATDSTQGTTTTTTASATYGTTLSSPDSLGTVTFTPITGDDLSVDAGGNVTTSGTLNAGTYTVAVAWTDSNGDSGTVTYTLTVTGVATDSTQGTTTTTTASATYGTTLSSPDSLGTVTFTPITGDDLSVDAGGNVTTSGTLNAGTYTVAVAWTDSNGDSGTVTYTLTVTGVATDSTQGTTTTTTASATYGTTLSSPDSLGTVTFTPITGDDLSVDAGGNVTTSGTLNAGTYTVAVAWTDSNGDSGTVTYTLTVTGVATDSTQGTTTTTTASATYGTTLSSPDSLGTVTFTPITGDDLSVDAGGNVTTSGTLNAGTYTVAVAWTTPTVTRAR